MTNYELMANDGYCTECGAFVDNDEQCPSCGTVISYDDDLTAEMGILIDLHDSINFVNLEYIYTNLIIEKNYNIPTIDELEYDRNHTWWPAYAGTPEFEMEAGDYRRYCD